MQLVTRALSALSHLFYPQLCAGCGNELPENNVLCLRCADHLPFTNFHLHANNPVEKIFWGRVAITAASSHLYFTKDSLIQSLLHKLKYHGRKEIGIYFGKKMGTSFLQSNRFNRIDIIVPVPLHPKKEKLRGYNQATVIGEGISEVMHLPLVNALERTGITETQTHKNRIERWNNISGKFLPRNPDAIVGKHILLVDDVVTTGATLESCANQLLQLEGVRVSIATVAYASR